MLFRSKDHKDLSESDWNVIEQLHEYWWRGEIPFTKIIPDLKDEMAVEQNLFTVLKAVAQEGIVFDNAK